MSDGVAAMGLGTTSAAPLYIGTNNTAAITISTAQAVTCASTLTAAGVFLAPNGSNTAPAYSFSGDTDTGLYSGSSNVWQLVAGTTICLLSNGSILRSSLVYNTTVSSSRDVEVNSTGDLGYVSSSIRFKGNIKDLDSKTTERIYDLQPKTFQYKKRDDYGKISEELEDVTQWGFIAEEAEKVLPELVYYGSKGEVDGFNYKGLITPLIAEVKKLRARVEELEKNK
jgi:hypothetical protein